MSRCADRLIRELEALRHPKTGERIVDKAYRREEVYSGPSVREAADVIPKWALYHGYNYVFRPSAKSPGLAWMEQLQPDREDHLKFFTSKSGSHRDNGIFVAHGSPIRGGFDVEGARIIDLAPTILHLLDVPVPEDMDGRVLEEIFQDSYLKKSPAWTTSEVAGKAAPNQNGCYSAEDEEKISERLHSLGYVE